MRKSFWAPFLALALALLVPAGAFASGLTFSTFVSSGDISAAEGQNQTIAFTYAGNKFVGSVYIGTNNFQLYSTDLTGHNVQKFGAPLPVGTPSGEIAVGASLGQGGFGHGDVFAGSSSDNHIYQYSNSGGNPTLFATLPSGAVRQIFFDPGSSFGGSMIVTTTSGAIYTVSSTGVVSLLANVGADTEGMDIATSAWGKYAGQLLVASEGNGTLNLISSTGVITPLGITLSTAETVSFVPLNLGASGNPIEGFYVANFPSDIQFADASQFSGLQGDAIVTQEFGSNSPVWDIKYDQVSDSFSMNQIGALPLQSEDGIFVTAQRIQDAPEPASILMLASGLLGFATKLRRKKN